MTGPVALDDAAAQLRALAALRFNWAATPDDVWDREAVHIDGLQPRAESMLMDGMEAAWRSKGPSPIGVVLAGSKGVGKTHLLGWIRQQVQRGDGYFFLVQHLAQTDFWRSVAQGILDGLLRPAHRDRDQLTLLLRALADKIGADDHLRAAMGGQRALVRADLDAFVSGLRGIDRQLGESADVARSLLLYNSPEMDQSDVGRAFVALADELDPADKATWGLQRSARAPQLVVRDLSRLLAASGEPTVIAVDQVDTLLAQSRTARGGGGTGAESEQFLVMLDSVADGVMALREETRRTLSVLSLLPTSWGLLESRSVATAADRFTELRLLDALPSPDKAAEFLAAYLGPLYAGADVVPPFPTWPVTEAALLQAPTYTAREVLQRVHAHARRCVEAGLPSLLDDLAGPPGSVAVTAPAAADDHARSGLDATFAQYRAATDVAALLDPAGEDVHVPELLRAALVAFVAEAGGGEWAIDPPRPPKKPALHARLRLVLDPDTEDEQHWAFRSVLAGHHRAVQTRLQDARIASGVAAGVDRRRLILLRNDAWPKGPRTAEMVAGILATSGQVRSLVDDDVRTFEALRRMLATDPPGLRDWLTARRPASRSGLFAAVLSDAPTIAESGSDPDVTDPVTGPIGAGATEGTIVLGRGVGDGAGFVVPLAALTKHAVLFAGSGSGKTVLLRRIIEECALQGVSSIVLDVNNDLVRLADAWPEPPESWWPGDAERAERFHADTDVVVWTPGRLAGRPLSLQALPDFAPFLDDADEFNDAITAAVATLAPRARLITPTPRVDQAKAVLREALEAFARSGQIGLRDFIDFLRFLPAEATRIAKGQKLAGELAEVLTAAMINDPLFGGSGQTVDPGLLLTPTAGKRARVSVVNLLGLPTPEAKESFVNELQLALFAWVKAHPAPHGELGGLFVMDEAQNFVSSRGNTSFGETTVALVSQARKYGLGMLFATQAPRNLDNRIPGNATTQIVGLLAAPVQIEAARELARARGGDVPDVARLTRGTFYMATEGTRFVKATSPMCLTAHVGPATADEVMARAAGAVVAVTGPEL